MTELKVYQGKDIDMLFREARTKSFALIVVSVLLLLLAGCESSYMIALPPVYCQDIFNCSPQELLNNEHDFLEKNVDFCDNSSIDMYGNLLLVLTKSQITAMRNAEWLTNFEDAQERWVTEVNDDFTSVTVSISSEMAIKHEAEIQKYLDTCCGKALFIQMLDKVSVENLVVYLSVIDTNTGEILLSCTVKPEIYQP